MGHTPLKTDSLNSWKCGLASSPWWTKGHRGSGAEMTQKVSYLKEQLSE